MKAQEENDDEKNIGYDNFVEVPDADDDEYEGGFEDDGNRKEEENEEEEEEKRTHAMAISSASFSIAAAAVLFNRCRADMMTLNSVEDEI